MPGDLGDRHHACGRPWRAHYIVLEELPSRPRRWQISLTCAPGTVRRTEYVRRHNAMREFSDFNSAQAIPGQILGERLRRQYRRVHGRVYGEDRRHDQPVIGHSIAFDTEMAGLRSHDWSHMTSTPPAEPPASLTPETLRAAFDRIAQPIRPSPDRIMGPSPLLNLIGDVVRRSPQIQELEVRTSEALQAGDMVMYSQAHPGSICRTVFNEQAIGIVLGPGQAEGTVLIRSDMAQARERIREQLGRQIDTEIFSAMTRPQPQSGESDDPCELQPYTVQASHDQDPDETQSHQPQPEAGYRLEVPAHPIMVQCFELQARPNEMGNAVMSGAAVPGGSTTPGRTASVALAISSMGDLRHATPRAVFRSNEYGASLSVYDGAILLRTTPVTAVPQSVVLQCHDSPGACCRAAVGLIWQD